MTPEQIAQICYQANRIYCEQLNDFSQPILWNNTALWQRTSVINGVKFHLLNPNVTPEAGHANWLLEKENDGWTYGKTKDPEKKTHPAMRPFHELPIEQQVKDHLFTAIVKALEPFVE